MNGTAQVNRSAIHWQTPKGDKPWGKPVFWKGEEIQLTLNFFKKRYNLQLDPCANNKEASMCDTYYTPEQDGLKQPWDVPTIRPTVIKCSSILRKLNSRKRTSGMR